ncbi:hypothetical protein VPHK225_0008 [Vibrio phage K225]|nr:hypothetical protein PODOV044v1_p0010 [Vibrio phage 23E28.1]QZI92081.1 hypothetical protein PODOV045v1_p0039 [Vibrio phage 69E27.1]
MAKHIITCPSVDEVKPNITTFVAAGTETFDSIVGENQIAIIIGEPLAGRGLASGKLQVAVRDLINHFVGEDRLGDGLVPALTGFTVTLVPTTIAALATAQATASTPVPAEASLGTIIWSSDNELAATVDANTGLVTGVATGSANIIGLSTNGGIIAQATITVS